MTHLYSTMNRLPQLTLESLRTLDAIDRRGSFAAAAEELAKVPSALSYSVQKMEDELDMLLFDRSGHRAQLTPVGKLILERGRNILLATQEMIDDAKQLSNGWETDIVIAVEALFKFEKLLPLINELADKAKTHVRLQDSVLNGTWELLENDQVDLVIGSEINAAGSDIATRPLYTDSLVYCAAPNHPIHQEHDPLNPDILRQHRAIAIADSAVQRPKREFRLFDNQPRLTVSTLPQKIIAMKQGLGIGSLPLSWIEQDLEQGSLKTITDGQPQSIEIILAWKNHRMGQAKQWLMQRITELCSEV